MFGFFAPKSALIRQAHVSVAFSLHAGPPKRPCNAAREYQDLAVLVPSPPPGAKVQAKRTLGFWRGTTRDHLLLHTLSAEPINIRRTESTPQRCRYPQRIL